MASTVAIINDSILNEKNQILLNWINYRIQDYNLKQEQETSKLEQFAAFPDFLRRHSTVEQLLLLKNAKDPVSISGDYKNQDLLRIEKLAACVSLVRTFIYPSGQPLDRFKLDRSPFIIDSEQDVFDLIYEVCLQDTSSLFIDTSAKLDIGALKADLVLWLKSCKELIHLHSEATPIPNNWYMNGQLLIEILRSFDPDLQRISPIDPDNNRVNMVTAYKLSCDYFKIPQVFDKCQILNETSSFTDSFESFDGMFLIFAFMLRQQVKLRILKEKYKQSTENLVGYLTEQFNEVKMTLDEIDLYIQDWPTDNNSNVLLQKFIVQNGTDPMENHLKILQEKTKILQTSILMDLHIAKRFVLSETESGILDIVGKTLTDLSVRLQSLNKSLKMKREILALIKRRQAIINDQMTQLIVLKSKIANDLKDDKTLLPEFELKLANCEQNAEVGLEIELINYLLKSNHEFICDTDKFREIIFDNPSPLDIEINNVRESLINEAKKVSKTRGTELFEMDVERVSGLLAQTSNVVTKLLPDDLGTYIDKNIDTNITNFFGILKNVRSCFLQIKTKECRDIESNLKKMREHGLKLVGKTGSGSLDIASTQRKLDNDLISLQNMIDAHVHALTGVIDLEEDFKMGSALQEQANSHKADVFSIPIHISSEIFRSHIERVSEKTNFMRNQITDAENKRNGSKIEFLDKQSKALHEKLSYLSNLILSLYYRNEFHLTASIWLLQTRKNNFEVKEMHQKVILIPLAELKVSDASFAEKFDALKNQCDASLSETNSGLSPQIQKLLAEFDILKDKCNNTDDVLFLNEISQNQLDLDKDFKTLLSVIEERISYINGFGQVRKAYLDLVEVERDIEPIISEVEQFGLLEESTYTNMKEIVRGCLQKLINWSNNSEVCTKFNHQFLIDHHLKLSEQTQHLIDDIERQILDSIDLKSFQVETENLLKDIQHIRIESSGDMETLSIVISNTSSRLKIMDDRIKSLEIKFEKLPKYREDMLKLSLRCQEDLIDTRKIFENKLIEVELNREIKPQTFRVIAILDSLQSQSVKFFEHFHIPDLIAWMQNAKPNDERLGKFDSSLLEGRHLLDSLKIDFPLFSEDQNASPVGTEFVDLLTQMTQKKNQFEQVVKGTETSLDQLKTICASSIYINQTEALLKQKVKELYTTNDPVTTQRRTADFMKFATETYHILTDHIKILNDLPKNEVSAFSSFDELRRRLISSAETIIATTDSEKIGIEESKQKFKAIEDSIEAINSRSNNILVISRSADSDTKTDLTDQFDMLKKDFFAIEMQSIRLPKKYNVQVLMDKILSCWLIILDIATLILQKDGLMDLIKERIQMFVGVINLSSIVVTKDHNIQVNEDIASQSQHLYDMIKSCHDKVAKYSDIISDKNSDIVSMLKFSEKLIENLAIRIRISTNLCVLHRRLYVMIRTLKESCADKDRLLKLQLDLDILKNEFNSITSSNLIPIQCEDRKILEDFAKLFNIILASIANCVDSYVLLLNMKETYGDKSNRVNTMATSEDVSSLILSLKLAEYESQLNSILIENSILNDRLQSLRSWDSLLVSVFVEKEEFKIIISITANLSESGLQVAVRNISKLKNNLEEILNDHIPYHERLTTEFESLFNQSISELRTFKNVIDLDQGMKLFNMKKDNLSTQIQSWQKAIEEHFAISPAVLAELKNRLTAKTVKLNEIPRLNRSLHEIAAKAKDLVIFSEKVIGGLNLKLNQIHNDLIMDFIVEIENSFSVHSKSVVVWEAFVDSESNKNNIVSLKDTFIFSKWNPKLKESLRNFINLKSLAESVIKSQKDYIEVEVDMENSLNLILQNVNQEKSTTSATYQLVNQTVRYHEFFSKLRQEIGPQKFEHIQSLKDITQRYGLLSERLESTIMNDATTTDDVKKSLKLNSQLQKIGYELDELSLQFEGLSCFKYMDIPSQALRTSFSNVGDGDLFSLASELQTAITSCTSLSENIASRMDFFQQIIVDTKENSKSEKMMNSFANLHSNVNYRSQEFREILKFIELVDKLRRETPVIQSNLENQTLNGILEQLHRTNSVFEHTTAYLSNVALAIEIIEAITKIENESSKQRVYPSSRDLIISVELFIEKLIGDLAIRFKEVFRAVFSIAHNNIRNMNAILFESTDFINETSRAYNRKLSEIDMERYDTWYQKLSTKAGSLFDSWSEKSVKSITEVSDAAKESFFAFKTRLHDTKLPYKYFDRIKFETIDQLIIEQVNVKCSEAIVILKAISSDVENLKAIAKLLPAASNVETRFKEYLPVLAKFMFPKSAVLSSEFQTEFDAEYSRWQEIKPEIDDFVKSLEQVEEELRHLKDLPKPSSLVESKTKSIGGCREQVDYCLKCINIQIKQFFEGEKCKIAIDEFENVIKEIGQQSRSIDDSDIRRKLEVIKDNHQKLHHYAKDDLSALRETVDNQRSNSELIFSSNLLMRYMSVSRYLRNEIIFHSKALIEAEKAYLYSQALMFLAKGFELAKEAHAEVLSVRSRFEDELLQLAQNFKQYEVKGNLVVSFQNTSYENVPEIHAKIIELNSIRSKIRDSVVFDIIDLELDLRLSELTCIDPSFPSKLSELKLNVSAAYDDIEMTKTWVQTKFERLRTGISLLNRCNMWTKEASHFLESHSDLSVLSDEEMWNFKQSLAIYRVIEREAINDSGLSDAIQTAMSKREKDIRESMTEIRSKFI